MADTDTELVTRALPEIVYSGGLKQLRAVSKINVDLDHGDAKAVNTMNAENEPIGYTDGVPSYMFNLEVAIEKNPEVDYYKLWRSKERFLFTYEEVTGEEGSADAEGNQRFQFVKARVKKVSKTFSESGAPALSVDCMALGHRPVQ